MPQIWAGVLPDISIFDQNAVENFSIVQSYLIVNVKIGLNVMKNDVCHISKIFLPVPFSTLTILLVAGRTKEANILTLKILQFEGQIPAPITIPRIWVQ